ncbi:MAG: hypothetical protein ACI8XO_001184 [Verrucomicrobiales bacterium]|jgi:hypothetical protein
MKLNKTTFKIVAIGALALLALQGRASAQETAPAKPIDMAARQRSIVNLERHITERDERLAELAQDIITLDARVEKRVDRLVDVLKQSKDSKDSKVSVARTKEKAIEGLTKTIQYYDGKRRGIKELVREESPIRDTLIGDVKKFDARIEKRVAQIVELTKSFTESEELKKYDETTRSDWGWSWTERRISEDWRQNRRDSNHTKLQDKGMMEALGKNIDYLKSRIVFLKAQLESKGITSAEKELYESDIARNESLIKVREEQIYELETLADGPKPDAVDRDRAHEIADLLEDTVADIREDFFDIFAKYSELNAQREQLAKLKTNLEARKKWMAARGSE